VWNTSLVVVGMDEAKEDVVASSALGIIAAAEACVVKAKKDATNIDSKSLDERKSLWRPNFVNGCERKSKPMSNVMTVKKQNRETYCILAR